MYFGSEKPSLETSLDGGTPFLFVQRWLNQCGGAKAIWARAQFDGARALQGGVGAKKWCDQACNDRQTQKNPRWMDSLLGEHLHKN